MWHVQILLQELWDMRKAILFFLNKINLTVSLILLRQQEIQSVIIGKSSSSPMGQVLEEGYAKQNIQGDPWSSVIWQMFKCLLC